MTTRLHRLKRDEIAQAFVEGPGASVPVILSPVQLAELLGLSVKTIYEWAAQGYLDGAFRKRGKHLLFWRDRALDRIFNGPEWKDGKQQTNPCRRKSLHRTAREEGNLPSGVLLERSPQENAKDPQPEGCPP